MTEVRRGASYDLVANFYDGPGGSLTDPSSVSLSFYYNGVSQYGPYTYAGGTVTKVSTGVYRRTFTAADDDELGSWEARWTAVIDGVTSTGSETFTVLDAAPYVTGAEIKAEAQSGAVASSAFDDLYDDVAAAVCDAIDKHCFRRFIVPTEATARAFRPSPDLIEVFDLADIASTSGLAVAVDSNESGSFTALDAADWAAETDELGMVVAIRSLSSFPWSRRRPRTIQVTARWGWPATPDAVKRAAVIWAVRLVNRRSSPTGVMGFGEFGGIRLSTMDPDVKALLAPYRRKSRLVL